MIKFTLTITEIPGGRIVSDFIGEGENVTQDESLLADKYKKRIEKMIVKPLHADSKLVKIEGPKVREIIRRLTDNPKKA